MATFNCMQKRPADDEGLHIDVKFTGLAGSDTETTGGVFEYQSVFSAVANFTECNELGEPIGEVLMETIYFSDETNFIGKTVTAPSGGLLLPASPVTRAGHEDVVLKHSVLAANPNKLYTCWLDFYIDGGSTAQGAATNDLANFDTVISSNEFIVMGKALASPTLVRDLKAPDDLNIYLTANWGNLPLSQKIITIRDVSDKTTMKGTSVNLVSLSGDGKTFVNAGNGEQKIILCASLPVTSATVKVLNDVVKVDSNQNYWVLFSGLVSDKTYSINAKVITRGLVQSATSPSVTVGYNPGAFNSPTIKAVRPGLTVNNVKMYFKAPDDVLTLKNLITPEIPNGLTLQSYKVTKESSVTFSFSGKMRKFGLETSANPLDLLDGSLIIDSNTKPFVAGTTLRVDGSVYNRGASDVLSGEIDIADCYVVDKTFPNLSFGGVPLTSVDFGLTAAYSGYKEQPQTCSATGLLSSVSMTVAPVINMVEILQDFESKFDSKGLQEFNYATGNITIKVGGQRMTNNFTGINDKVNLYWGLTEDLKKIRDGVARYTDAVGQPVPAVPARALLASDFAEIDYNKFSVSLPTNTTESDVFGAARNYVIKMSQSNIPGFNGQDITFYVALKSSNSDVSKFDEKKVITYTKQASPSNPVDFMFVLTNDNKLKATLTEVDNFGLGSETVKEVTKLINDTKDDNLEAIANLQTIANTVTPTVAATQGDLFEFSELVGSIYEFLSVKDKYTKAIIAINAVSEAAEIIGGAGTLTQANQAKWVDVNTKLATAVNTTLPIPPAVTATTITPAAAATAASLSVLATKIADAAVAAANASTNNANFGAAALTALASAATEALKAIKNLQIQLQTSLENYDMSDLTKRLAKATDLEKNAKVIIGYKSWITRDQLQENPSQIKFIELSVNSSDYNNLIDVSVGYYLAPEGGDADWKEGRTVQAWIESINVKSIFNGNYTFETSKATAVAVDVLKVPAQVQNEAAIPLELSAGAVDTSGDIRYKFDEPETGDATKNFKIVYKKNGSPTPIATYYFSTRYGNDQGLKKRFEVIIYKTGVVPDGGRALTTAGNSGSYTEVSVDNFNTIYMAHKIEVGYDFGDLITADIYNIGITGVLATVYKTLNLVPAKPATIDTIAFSVGTGVYANDDIVTYTISNNGSAIESLYSLDVFGNLLLPTSVEPVTQFTFETNKTIYSGSVVNAISTVKSDGTLTTLYTDKSSPALFNAQFKDVNTNALTFKPPSRVVKGGDLSAAQPDYLVSNVISCEASGSTVRNGAAVPDKTVIVLKYDTSEAKSRGGSTAGLQAVFAILYSKQTTQQNVPSYCLKTVSQATTALPPVVR